MKRFWEKVKKTDGCWTWMGAKDRKGYGKFSIGGSRNADGSRRNSMVSAHITTGKNVLRVERIEARAEA